MKLDLRTSLPYLPDISWKQWNTTLKYFADFSGSAEKIAQYDNACFGDEVFNKSEYSTNDECQFLIHDPELDIRYGGYLSYDDIYFTPNLKIGKWIIGRVKSQSHDYLHKGINGILGLGPSSFDNAFKDSWFNQVVMETGIDEVFTLCANGHKEGGGYLMLGGLDMGFIRGDTLWLNYNYHQHYR